ncbi:Gamma-interferon-responsive lysosomal thiol protein [Geodia barretti]|uniref:Gamma-interferon-responsive lysosomal thiol protein n=1 Tax=Geodia barretti TaxID=519541 RepID=A0AA35RNE0_GEOBA|nr:Gamma-interferon-responsive lysosomal thiol protein [Geodia barretti]
MSIQTLAVLAVVLAGFCGGAQSAEKVQLGFYSESLCPDCIDFANGPLEKAMNEIGSIFTLNYVPWGNAILKNDGTIECQHGKLECTLNTVEACTLYYYKTETEFWPFLHCLDEKIAPTLDGAQQCFSQLSYNWTAVDACLNSEQGYKLDLMYYNETQALKPPHEYTPWITVNGKHDPRAEGSGLIKAICEAYTGEDKPDACSQK